MEFLKLRPSHHGHAVCLSLPSRLSSSRRRLHFIRADHSHITDNKKKASSSPYTQSSPQFPLQKSRGEVFLENALSKRNSTSRRKEPQEKKKKDKKDNMSLSKLRSEPGCYGCGATLQAEDEEAPGYLHPEIYEMKRKHHQLKTVLCGRCRSLAHGQMIPAVGGHGGYGGGKRFISADQLRIELSHIRNEKALIIKLVDIIDINGSFLTRIRDIVGANPIVLVLTKVDLLPRGTNFAAIGDWILEFIVRKKLNVISVHLTSSKSLAGISSILSYIRQQRQGRNVYILGSANVGKSAFVGAILQELSKRDLAASAVLRHLPIQSAMPGTTLGPIEIKAFSGGGSLFDTPGIHVHHRMAAVVSPNDLTLLAPRRRLQGQLVAPVIFKRGSKSLSENGHGFKFLDGQSNDTDNVSETSRFYQENFIDKDGEASLSGTSVLWGGIVRLDIVKAPPFICFRFYGPNSIPKETVATSVADKVYKEQLGKALTPPTCSDDWHGLPNKHNLKLKFLSWDRPACDIAISGLGWITVESGYAAKEVMQNIDKEVDVVIHVPKSVEVFVRPPLPIGFHGYEWYEFRELSDRELEARPMVYLP